MNVYIFFVSHIIYTMFLFCCKNNRKNMKGMKGSETHESLEIPGEMKKTAIARGLGMRADGGTRTRTPF